jgi:emfourin
VARQPPDAPITFERHGGFGGIVLRTTFTSSELTQPEAEAITAAQDEKAQQGQPQPDRFAYHLHLPNGRIVINEEDLPDTLRPLVTRLLERARQRPA